MTIGINGFSSAPGAPAAPAAGSAAPAAPVAPAVAAPGAPAVTPAAAPVADVKAELAKLEAARADIAKKERAHVVATRKHAEEKKGWGEKLSEYEKLKKERVELESRLTRAKSVFGEKWNELVDGAPMTPEQFAAAQAAQRDELKAELQKELEARDATAAKTAEESRAAAVTQARARLTDECGAFVKANEKDLALAASVPNSGQLLASRIEAEYNSSGKLLSTKEAAELVEADVVKLAKQVAAHPKYKETFRSELFPAAVQSKRPESPQRRTLTNDLTAASTGRQPTEITDEDRRRRADEAWESVRQRRPAGS